MTSLRLSSALFAACAALTPLTTGCSLLAGDQTAEVHFQVAPRTDGTWSSWNGLTISDPTGTTDAILLSVTFDPADPTVTEDLSFLGSVVGFGANGDLSAQFCSQNAFPPGESVVTANVDYHDNIVPFFANDTILLTWSGTVTPGTILPDGGVSVRARLQVEPQ